MQILARTALVALFGLAANASAEPRVCIGGDLDRLSQSEKSTCRASAEQVRRDAVRFHAPEDWHFVVVCTESDWATYAAISAKGASLAPLNVDTDMTRRMTFFRGATLAMGDSPLVHRLIAHEAARGLLQSMDEAAIAKQVSAWMPEGSGGAVTLTASR